MPVEAATNGPREAVKVLVGAGPEDDRRSLYGSVRIASTTGGAAGDVVTLAAAPPPEPDARLRVPEGALLIRPVIPIRGSGLPQFRCW